MRTILKKWENSYWLILFMAVFIFATYYYQQSHPYTDASEEQRISYVKGTVTEIEDEELSQDIYNPEGYTGKQMVKIRLEEGENKGKEISVTNYLATTYYVYLEEGDSVLVSWEAGTDGETYYMVHQYYRVNYLFLAVLVFLLLILAVGRIKGIKTIISLAFDLYTLLYFTLPFIYNGASPVMISIWTVVIITGSTLFLLNGGSQKTWSAVLSTAFGVIAAGVVFSLFSGLMHLTGYNTTEADAILILIHTHGLQMKYILFASILIASLGAVMDVGMSIASSLYEMALLNPEVERKTLFLAGVHVGQDMIGTMTNTLVLAFAGGSFVTMIAYASYNMQWNQLLCNDYIVIEVLQGLSGTMAVVLTVPIGAAVSAYLYTLDKKHKKVEKGDNRYEFGEESQEFIDASANH